MKEKDKLIMEP